MILNPVVGYILLGFALLTVIATLGATLSGKMKFNYGWLILFSIAVYTYIGFLVAIKCDLFLVLVSTAVIGLYDATAGWNLCLRFNAMTGLTEEEMAGLTQGKRVATTLLFSTVFGVAGYLLAG